MLDDCTLQGKSTFVSPTVNNNQSTQTSTPPENNHEALIIILSVIASIAVIMAIVFLFLYLRYVIIIVHFKFVSFCKLVSAFTFLAIKKAVNNHLLLVIISKLKK